MMQAHAIDHTKPTTQGRKPEPLSWGLIEFQVTDLDRTIQFWTHALGLTLRAQTSERAELGTKTKTLFVFRPGATRPAAAPFSGMYHVAIGMPDQAEFSRLLARLVTLQIPVSPTDHLLAKSLYLSDPDGLEIELTLETPQRFGRFGDMSRGLIMYDAEGNPHSGRAALDTKAELSHAKNADLQAPLSDQTYLAHMHFKVPDLEKSATWFEGIGFSRGLTIANWGFADMNANDAHTHRLAMNIWAGPNRPPAPADMARLTRYAVHIHAPDLMENIQGLQPNETGLAGIDPTGTEISLLPAY